MSILFRSQRRSCKLINANLLSRTFSLSLEPSNEPKSPIELVQKDWTPNSKRIGILGVKIGMMPVWDDWGYRHNCTVVQIEECQVTQVKQEEKHGYTALQLGAGLRKPRNVTKPVKGHLAKAGVPTKRSIQEFRCTEDALLPPGTTLNALHFVPGQYVDICGISKGKGFQGVMKRHNFSGQNASHGNSKTHRHPGSTGQCQDPGRVFKGKKMAGRMGNARVTRDNLWVCKIDTVRNLLYVKGSVPGNKGGIVRITDARKKLKKDMQNFDIPFPTFIPKENEEIPNELFAPASKEDPYYYA